MMPSPPSKRHRRTRKSRSNTKKTEQNAMNNNLNNQEVQEWKPDPYYFLTIINESFDEHQRKALDNLIDLYKNGGWKPFLDYLKTQKHRLGVNKVNENLAAKLYCLYILKITKMGIPPRLIRPVFDYFNYKFGRKIITYPREGAKGLIKYYKKLGILVPDDKYKNLLNLSNEAFDVLTTGINYIRDKVKHLRHYLDIVDVIANFEERDPFARHILKEINQLSNTSSNKKDTEKKLQELYDQLPLTHVRSNVFCLNIYNVVPPWRQVILNRLFSEGIEAYKYLVSSIIVRHLSDVNPTTKKELVETASIVSKYRLMLALDEEDMRRFEVNTYYGEQRAFIIDGVLVSYTSNLKMYLWNLYVCHNKHVFLSEPHEIIKSCPICSSPIAYATKYYEYGTRAIIEVFGSSSEAKDSFSVFIPMYIWRRLLEDFSSRKILLVSEIPREIPIGKKSIKVQFLAFGAYFGKKTTQIPPSSENEIKRLASRPTWEILKTLSSILYGHVCREDHAKIAALLTAFSQGKDKIKLPHVSTSKPLYGPLYTLLIGAPQSAKSDIVSQTIRFTNSDFAEHAFLHAGSITTAGMIASYDRDSGGLKLGIEPLNHGRIVAYDELDKASDKDSVIANLASIMSEYYVKYHKATFRLVKPAVSAKLFAANLYGDLHSITDPLDLVEAIKEGGRLPSDKYQRKAPLFGKSTDPFISRIDLLVFLPGYVPSYEILKYQRAFKPVNLPPEFVTHYVQYIHNYLSPEETFTEVTEEAINTLYDLLSKIMDVGGIFAQILSQPRRLETIYKMARAIARMHLRNKIISSDIKEAIAFFIFIHCYPFLTKLNSEDLDRLGKLFNMFKNELGEYYSIIKEHPEYHVVFVEPEPVGEESKKEIIISSEEDLKNFVVETVRAYGKIDFLTLANVLADKFVNGEVKVDPKKTNTAWGKKLSSGNKNIIRDFFVAFNEKLRMRGVLYEPEQNYYSVF